MSSHIYSQKRRNNLLQGDTSFYFITYRKPIRPAHKDARWTESIVKESGVDTKIFKSHSSRSATASAATNAGIADDDLKQGDWTNDSTFYKNYFKEIENSTTFSEDL